MTDASRPILEARGIFKSFPGVDALIDFDIDVARGEIHGLLGENGAGKSTFIKLLNGLYSPDRGRFVLGDLVTDRIDPILARARGLRFVHQEPTLFPHLTVAENICMNSFPKRRLGIIDWRRARAEAARLLAEYDLGLDPADRVSDLSVGQMQLVEIISNVSKNARLVVLDEPTASLGDAEKAKLYAVMRALRERGVSIIFISHILEEVLALCDRITILRDGRKIGTFANVDLTKEFLIENIVGSRRSGEPPPRGRAQASGRPVALSVRDLRVGGILRRVSFDLRYGEIVGILGLLGSGKSELADACFGLLLPASGRILVDGRTPRRLDPRSAIRSGIGYLTEDRHRSGLFPFLSIRDNCSISILDRLKGFLAVVRRKRERAIVARTIESLSVRAPSVREAVSRLSGGNQQKVLLARWLAADQRILLFDEPTKGVDVGARSEFYRQLRGLRDAGKAILVLTSDHREAVEISDRLFLLSAGVLSEFDLGRTATSKDVLAALSLGGPP